MSFESFMDQKLKKLDYLDLGLIKWSCIAFGLLLAIIFPALTRIDLWLVVAAVILFGVRPLYRTYLK